MVYQSLAPLFLPKGYDWLDPPRLRRPRQLANLEEDWMIEGLVQRMPGAMFLGANVVNIAGVSNAWLSIWRSESRNYME